MELNEFSAGCDSERSSHDKSLKGNELEAGFHGLPFGLPADPDANVSPAERIAIDRRLRRKLDFTLIPWMCVLYLLSFLDRTNIGNARIAGLQDSFGSGGHQMSVGKFNAVLTIFFVSYSLAEPITNVLLKSLTPRRFIPIIMILWGTCMTFMGFAFNWSGLMAARWFLGLAEAGLFPGVNYYLSCWYRRSEFGVRAAIFFSAAAFAGSFGGSLAAAIEKMNSIGGRPGWAWIFILEGVLTVLFGIASFWAVQNFPDKANFLSEQDRARVLRRLKLDKQSSAEFEVFSTKSIQAAFKDYKMYLGMLIYMGCDMPLYAFSLFLPKIIKDMGYEDTQAQLLTVPPYACAAVLTVIVGFVADRTRQRGLCNICVSIIGIIGFATLIATENPHIKYIGTFLAAAGIYPCIANTISWVANNIEGVYKRGVVLGCVIGWGNLNGIVSSNIYQNAPYKGGHCTVLVYMSVCLLGGSITLRTLLARENKKRLTGKRDYWVRGLVDQYDIEKLGDKRPDFIYTL